MPSSKGFSVDHSTFTIQERNVAAVKIQDPEVVRSFLHRLKAKRQGYAARNALRLKEEAQRQALRCNAATVIQAQWRMYTARRAYQHLNYSAIVVQAHWRMRRASSAYARMLWAAAVIQKYTRAWTTARRERQHYISLRTLVVQLQRNYRRWKAQRLERLNQAAKVIQTAFCKWHKERTARTTAAALKIQSWYRMHMCLLRYAKIKRSALVIQAHYKGYTQRRCFQRLRLLQLSAIVIQSALRGHVVRKGLTVMRQASVVIPTDLDMKKARVAATAIQAAYRGHVARRLLKEQHQAATVIQTAFRKFAAQRRYLSLKTAAMAIQKWYRAMALAQKKRKEYEVLRHAALSIQAVWRGRADRKKLEKRHQSATLIQAHYRRHKAHTQYKSRKAAAIVMQRQFRAYMAGKVMRADYLQVKGAAVILQVGFRGMKVRRELRETRQAATVIQSAVRMTRCRKRYLLLQSATIIIQSRYRALLEGKEQQREYRRLRHGTMKIQAAYRGFKVREDLKQKKDAATVIQAHFRMHKVRVAYLATKCAAVVVQERYRAQRLRNEQVQRYRTMRSATVVIQAAYRGHRARLEVAEMHRAAIVLQRRFHTLKDRKRFLAIKCAAVFCQQKYRAINLAKNKLNYLMRRRAIISIQTAYRGVVVRQQMHTEPMAAITIVSLVRKYVRGHQARREIARQNQAATLIQSWRTFKRQREATVVLQRKVRAVWLARTERDNYNRMRSAAITLQFYCRRWITRRQVQEAGEAQKRLRFAAAAFHHLSAIRIQRSLRAHWRRRLQRGIIKAQALWRGHRSRMLHDNLKVVKVRHSLQRVSTDVREEDKLCNKTSIALDNLLKYKDSAHILEALLTLETATRLSPECCERLVESGATVKIFILIRSCNRSIPCMEIIAHSIQILLNLTKYHKTTEAVYAVENSVETLLDLLQRYREKAGDKVADKGGSIFTKACFLLALLLQDRQRAQEVKTLPKALDRISSIYRLTARKFKMDAERTLVRNKMNAYINGSFLQATPRKSRHVPKFGPDWVLEKNKLKDIVDPIRAIGMVAEVFFIVL